MFFVFLAESVVKQMHITVQSAVYLSVVGLFITTRESDTLPNVFQHVSTRQTKASMWTSKRSLMFPLFYDALDENHWLRLWWPCWRFHFLAFQINKAESQRPTKRSVTPLYFKEQKVADLCPKKWSIIGLKLYFLFFTKRCSKYNEQNLIYFFIHFQFCSE